MLLLSRGVASWASLLEAVQATLALSLRRRPLDCGLADSDGRHLVLALADQVGDTAFHLRVILGASAPGGLGHSVGHYFFFHFAALRAKLAFFFMAGEAFEPGLRTARAFCCTLIPDPLAALVKVPRFDFLILMGLRLLATSVRRRHALTLTVTCR